MTIRQRAAKGDNCESYIAYVISFSPYSDYFIFGGYPSVGSDLNFRQDKIFIKKATGNMWSQSPNHSRDRYRLGSQNS